MIQVYHPLRSTACALSFTLIGASGVIGKNIPAVLRKIIRAVHIRIVPAIAEAVSKNHDSALILAGAVKISGQHLTMIGRESIFPALKSAEILKAQHQRFIAVAADIEVLVVEFHTEHSPGADRQNDDAQKNHEYDFLFGSFLFHWLPPRIIYVDEIFHNSIPIIRHLQ